MTAQQIITQFRIYADLEVGDISSAEELALLNASYTELQVSRLWNWLKKFTALSFTGDVATLPADFRSLSYDRTVWHNQYTQYPIRSYDERRGTTVGFHLDGNTIIKNGIDGTGLELDYIRSAPVLTLSDTPLFASAYHDMLARHMASRLDINEQMEKGRTYASENLSIYNDYYKRLVLEDSLR